MKFLGCLLGLSFLITACCRNENEVIEHRKEVLLDETPIESEVIRHLNDSIMERYNEIGLVSVDDPRILIDLKYASKDNFMKMVLYDTLDRVFLQDEVVVRLSKCQDLLDTIKPGFRLKIYDGTRPLLVQREMWNALDSVPLWKRGKFVSNPIFGSVHNYGCAVDITICNELGEELDMGAGYDDFRAIAFPSMEKKFLKSGELSQTAYQNRLLLRKVMSSQKFYNIPSEWWHFNAFSRPTSEAKFEILLTESGDHRKWVSPQIKSETSDSLSNP